MTRAMKNKIGLTVAAMALSMLTVTCNRDHEKTAADVNTSNNSSEFVSRSEYNNMLAAKNSTEDTLYRAIDEIDTRLRTVRETNGLMMNEHAEKFSRKEAILRTLDEINSLLEENKSKIKKLNGQLASLRKQRSQWKRDADEYTGSIAEKEQELAALNKQVGFQATTINYLNQIVNDLKLENDKVVKNAKQMDTELHKAYYALGSHKELKEHKVIEASGGVLGLGKTEALKADVEKNYFTEIDTRQVTTIPVNSKKAKLVTHHPVGSYEWEKSESGNAEALTIKDPDKFWATSRYLVVEVK